MSIEAKVIADSVSQAGARITTLQLKFPRFILAQFNTHRCFSRNARSSRAVPVAKIIEEVTRDPVIPLSWRQNRPGMVAGAEFPECDAEFFRAEWLEAMGDAVYTAERLASSGLAKETANRILEPFMWAHVVVTATEWENFFALRLADDAQPEMQALAGAMLEALRASTPRDLEIGEWHLPYVTDQELADLAKAESGTTNALCVLDALLRFSVARCARVSYKPFDSSCLDRAKDLDLANRLLDSGHMSPFEHQAQACLGTERSANFRGWFQYRQGIEGETRSFDLSTATTPHRKV